MVSIVIPLYNKAHTIIATLDTVFNQTFQNFEVVIVNDGSTDNGVDIISQKFQDPRLRIISQENQGVSAARNRGVDEAKGEWVAFLDGDDKWHPDYLGTMYTLICRYPEAVMFLCAGLIENPGEPIYYRMVKGYEGYMGPINIFLNPPVFSHTSATIVNRKKFNATHRFIVGMNKFEDFLATQTLALLGEVIYCGIPLTKYVGGVEGQLTKMNMQNREKCVNFEIQYYNTLYRNYKVNKRCIPQIKKYMKYNIRHTFKQKILQNDLSVITLYKHKLLPEVSEFFFQWEWFLFKKTYFLSILWINFTKIIWRMSGSPWIGQRIKLNKISKSYLSW